MSHYLVTGTAGFIASRTAALLLAEGATVTGIDSLNDSYDVRLKQARLKSLAAHERFLFQQIDVEDTAAIKRLLEANRFDAVLHLAGRCGVRYSVENPQQYFTTNGVGTLNVLEAMRQSETRKIVISSTSSLYAGQPTPFVESLPVNTPISSYAASKKAAEVLAYTYHHLFGIDVSILRYFTVYGPAGRPDMSPFRFIKWIDEGKPIQLFGDGTQSRDFTYVDDIARATVAARKRLGYEIINVGGGRKPSSLIEMISVMEELLGKKAKIDFLDAHKTDMTETQADISKAHRLLDWQPQVELREGMARTVQWYRENHDWAKDIAL